VSQQADLGSLLAAGEQALFHGAPAAGIAPLTEAVATAYDAGRSAEEMAARWLLGTTFSVLGRFGAALAALEPAAVADGPAPAEQRLFASLAFSTLATVHRQLGRTAEAHTADLRALALTDGTGEAGVDAVLGLAADEVAAGRPDQAWVHLDRAAASIGDPPVERPGRWWRQQVRLDWARAGAEQGADAPGAAAEHAAAAVRLAEQATAPAQVAQGLLLLGSAQARMSAHEAGPTLRRAAALAEAVGGLPVRWAAQASLAGLLSTTDPEASRHCRESARIAVRTIAEDLPAVLREAWLHRPDVAALLDGA